MMGAPRNASGDAHVSFAISISCWRFTNGTSRVVTSSASSRGNQIQVRYLELPPECRFMCPVQVPFLHLIEPTRTMRVCMI